VVARLFTALILILIARQTGPKYFGQYTACFTVAWLAAPLFSLGLNVWLLGNGRRSGLDKELSISASACLVLKGGLGLLWLGLLAAIVPVLEPTIFPPSLFRMAVLTVWLDDLTRLVVAAFQTGGRNRTAVVLLILSQALILLVVGTLALIQEKEIYFFTLAQLATTGISSILGIAWLKRQYGFSFRPEIILSTALAARPYGLSMFLSLVYGRAGAIIVAYWLGTTEAGYYSPAISILSALALLPLAFQNIVLPIFSQAEARNRLSLPRLIHQALLISGALGVLMGGTLFITARWLIDFLYGENYRNTGVVLMILGGVLLARCINLSAAAALISLHLQRKRVVPQTIAAFFNLIVNIAIVQRWGINGVAIVFVLTESGLIVAYLWLVWRAVGTIRLTETAKAQ